MKPKKILIVRKMSALEYFYNGNHESKELLESHNNHNESLKRILKTLDNFGWQYDLKTRRELGGMIQGYDFIFSAGGDGTVIATAAFNVDIPQLNLKTDEKSKGYLCISDIYKALECLNNGDYKLKEWTRQDITLDNNLIGRALNETAVGEDMNFTKMTKYHLHSNGKKELHRNSGLIIVTGTGSSGWPSAFSQYEKNSRTLKFRTVLPYEGSETGEGECFRIEYRGHEGKFAIDTKDYKLPRDSALEVKLSDKPLRVVAI